MQYSSPRGGTPQHSATTSSRTPREQGGRRRAAAGSANAANPRNYTSSVVSVTSPLVRRRDARGVDGSWHMAVLFRCIESYGVVAPLEDDCHPCVQVIINLFAPRQESRRPTAASTTDLCATSVNIQTLAATTVAGSAVDALARARRRRRSPRLRASNRCASHDRS